MANIKVKNNAGTEVVYNNVDTLVLPTTDGTGVVFRKWNGAERYDHRVSVNTRVGKEVSVNIVSEPPHVSAIAINTEV